MATHSTTKIISSDGKTDDINVRKRCRVRDKEDQDAKGDGINDRNNNNNNSNNKDIYTQFDDARNELERAEKHMASIREQIRSMGLPAPDSLLFLADGEGSPLLTTILLFLSTDDVGRCEVTCQCLRAQAAQYWSHLVNKGVLANSPHCKSPSANNDPRKLVIRYQLASTLAERIGGLGDTISRHVYTLKRKESYDSDDEYFGGQEEFIEARVSNCQGCDFPDLDFGVCRSETRDNYELYVRFSRTADNALLAEGFLPFRPSDGMQLNIDLEGLNTSKWSKMEELMSSIEGDVLNDDLLHSCMRELTATIVAVNKTSFEATLVAAQCNFAGEGIDNMEGHGFCWPLGRLASRSHGDLETIRKTCGFGSDLDLIHTTTLSNASLGMIHDTRHDPNNPEETREWFWTLICDCTLARTEDQGT